MNGVSTRLFADQAAVTVLSRPLSESTIQGVLERMAELEAVLYPEDGTSAFLRVYAEVTREVEGACDRSVFANPAFIRELVVRFAQFFFDALRTYHEGAIPPADVWCALFHRRFVEGIAPVQYALAGVNAHICYDLPQAIRHACIAVNRIPRRDMREYEDYLLINELLDQVEIRALHALAGPRLRALVESASPWSERLLMDWIRAARAQAWEDARRYWFLTRYDVSVSADLLTALDQKATRRSRILLLSSGLFR